MKKYIVCDSGQRGNHGCTSEFVVEGKLYLRFCGQGLRRKGKIVGKVVEQSFCGYCDHHNLIGEIVEWEGIVDKEYYKHPYLQL